MWNSGVSSAAVESGTTVFYELDTWVYRRNWEWDMSDEFPYLSPWVFRFVPQNEDIVVEMGQDGRVVSIQWPVQRN